MTIILDAIRICCCVLDVVGKCNSGRILLLLPFHVYIIYFRLFLDVPIFKVKSNVNVYVEGEQEHEYDPKRPLKRFPNPNPTLTPGESCLCSPSTYRFTIDFLLTPVPYFNFFLTPAIAFIGCRMSESVDIVYGFQFMLLPRKARMLLIRARTIASASKVSC